MKSLSGTNKATHGHIRRHNQQLVLRAVYNGVATSRAALAQETGLTKPTVSELIDDLIAEGYLEEVGRGESTSGGGKRPRLLKFVPWARQVIGVHINDEQIMGALAVLDGRITARHCVDLNGAQGQDVIEGLIDVINGLLAQCDAPLLAIGIGVSGVVDEDAGVVHYAPHLGWRQVDLAGIMRERYGVSVYVANSTALVAMAQYVYGPVDNVPSFATLRVGSTVGVGLVINGAIYRGGEIGHLRIAEQSQVAAPPDWQGRLESFLGWRYVKQRAYAIRRCYPDSSLPQEGEPIRYLHIRQGVANGDPAALAIQDELSVYLAQVFAWIIGLLRPNYIALSGPIADMGQPLLDQTIARTRDLVLPDLAESVTYFLTETDNLVAVGAIAQALHRELGLV